MEDRIISWYSGYKTEEYPLSFLYKGDIKKTIRLIETKLIENSYTGQRERKFTVETTTGEIYHISVGTEIKIRLKKK